ncbi:type II secretion system F family protein [Candidatus Babeliales bacterium]|nr:type II secretion system F family protein [Candidatus Babeliales bacterium]MBY0352949.1 type II secretion system F family protein [Candidatus Babeliales bacterium]
MPLYKYDSFNRRGGRVTGTIDAVSLHAAKEILQGQGLMPVNIKEITAGSAAAGGFSLKMLFERPIEVKVVVLFTKQLAVLLRAGIPLLQALELLIEQFEGRFNRLLIRVRDGVKSGEPFAKELSKYPKVFSNVYVQLVRAGEASGNLDSILESLTDYLERAEETRKKVKKAMSQPIMMLSFAGLVVVGLLTVLVPRLQDMFKRMKTDLPVPTKILVALSNLLVHHFLEIAGGLLLIVVLFTYWKSTKSGAYKFDEILLKFPVTAYFSRTKAIVQFSKTLGMLINSGVNLAEALDIVCNIVENRVLVQKLRDARDKIIKEGKIAKYLKQTGIFPSIASYMISTGEESGKLGAMLLTVGHDYDVELKELTDGLTAKIGPIMTVVMGLIVGFIIMSIFLPVLKMGDITNL